MQSRMKSPAAVLSGAYPAIMALMETVKDGGVPQTTLDLVHLRASQINGCSSCVHSGIRSARKSGVDEDRLACVAAWREAPFFTAAERAALELTESATRLADQCDAVPDEVWDRAATHYDESGLAALVMNIALTNLFNRLNVSTRQIAGAWG